MKNATHKCYQKKGFIALSLIALMIGGFLANNPSTPNTKSTQSHNIPATQIKAVTPTKQTPSIKEVLSITPNSQENETVITPTKNSQEKPTEDVPLSNNNHYINTRGEETHSPAYAPSVPQGASAVCRDGTYSFSQSRRGTCSHHGGVSEWL